MKKSKNLIVRITEDQLVRLHKCLIIEKQTKSELLRELIEEYLKRFGRIED